LWHENEKTKGSRHARARLKELMMKNCSTLTGSMLFVLLVASACDREPKHPRAGQVVHPANGQLDSLSWPRKSVRVSLYETNDDQDHITGQSVSFEIPREYMLSALNRRGGPQSSIGLEFDPIDDKPYTRASYANDGAFREAAPRLLTVWLERSAPTTMINESELTEQGRYPRVGDFIRPQKLRRISEDYCAYQVYVGNGPIRGTRVPSDGLGATQNPQWPFAEPVVFARAIESGKFSPVIACAGQPQKIGYPICGVTEVYRGWPMSLTFPGSQICSVEKVVQTTQAFLDHYRVSETQRSPGQIEHRFFK
jgi:hypothetical protein